LNVGGQTNIELSPPFNAPFRKNKPAQTREKVSTTGELYLIPNIVY